MSSAPRGICFTLNGVAVVVSVTTNDILIDVLHDRFDLFGARESRVLLEVRPH